MPRPRKHQIDFASRAEFFNVCEKTVRRWHASGVDVMNLEAVADHILRQRTSSREACQKVHHQLSEL